MSLKKIADLIEQARLRQLDTFPGAKDRAQLSEEEWDDLQKLIEDVDSYWKTQGEDRLIENDGFHPSHLGVSYGKCARRAVYLLRGESKQQEFSAKTKRIFANGNDVHTRTQTALDALDPNSYSFVAEQAIWLAEPPVAGHADGVLTFHWNNKVVLVEIKSINANGYELRLKWKKALPKHFDQANIYAYILGLDYILFIYENKNTQELFYIWERADPKAAKKQIDKWAKIYKVYEAGNLPVRPYKQTSEACTYCDMKKLCWEDIELGVKP